jgi:23S rRNA (cytosine1962-C5)-methyltransferase
LRHAAARSRGETPERISFVEHGLRFNGGCAPRAKTGFFLDQRENRNLVRSLAKGGKVINLCSYSGGFSIAALAGGADTVISVDISSKALAEAEQHVLQNGFDPNAHNTVAGDVFEFVRRDLPDHDLIILDPPSFTSNRNNAEKAARGYKDLHSPAFPALPAGYHASELFLLTSC